MPQRYWFIILVYIIIQFSPRFGIPLFDQLFPAMHPIDQLVYWQVATMAIGLFIVLHLLRDEMKPNYLRSNPSTGSLIGWSIGGVFIAYGAQILANIINLQIIGVEEASENTMLLVDVVEANFLFILVIVLFAPIYEELIFRKIMFGQLYKRMNFFFAALISSLLFSVLHLDFTYTLTYVAMGFAFSYLYVKTKRIIVPIIAHAAMNLTAVLINLYVDIEDLERRLEEIENAAVIIGGL